MKRPGLDQIWSSSLLLTVLLSACASSSSESTDAKAPPAADVDAGEQCLKDARTPRHPPENAPERIEVRQILVRHRELKRPQGATRTPVEACLRARAALGELEQGKLWADVAKEFNDAGSDNLGRVSRGELSPAFADAAFELTSGEVSYVVESDRGFHVILRK